MRSSIIALADVENRQQPRTNDRRRFGQHPGQLLQRFLADTMIDPKTGTKRDKRDPAELRALLDAAIAAGRNESLQKIYKAAYNRWDVSFPEDDLNSSMELSTQGRLIMGLGTENVLETGIRLHHTYGVPFIPGSALKGLASHYCNEVWGQLHVEAPDQNNRLFRRDGCYHRLLFGTTEDGGVITFHDAWITPASLRDGSLRLDVMTPHHPKWQTNKAPPTDFDSPVPVSFLSVAGTFQVRLSWTGPVEMPLETAVKWMSLAMNLLQEAVAESGIGGKTSSGYGRLLASSAQRPTPTPPTATQARPPSVPQPGDRVEAVLLDEKTRKGGWRAKHVATGIAGPIQKSADVPSDKKPGDSLTLIVASATGREIAFRYPTDDGRHA